MSCCDGNQLPAVPEKKQAQIDKIMASLPQVVLAASDPRHPLASSIRNSMPLPSDALYALPKVHEDGSLEYTPTHADPPPEPAGWLRDPQNPWLFRPQWPECMLRMAGVRKTASGAIEVRMVCNNPAVTEHYMKYIKLPDCTSCTKRKNPA